MAISRAQTKVTASSTSATSLNVSFGGAPTAGNLHTISASGNGLDTMATPTGFGIAAQETANGVGANIFSRTVLPGDTTGPYTISQTNAGTIACCMDEWTGFAGGDIEVVASGVATKASTGTASITVNIGKSGTDSELVLMVAGIGGNNATAPTASGGMTQDTGLLVNSFDLAIATPTTATSFTAAVISWTTDHSTDACGAIFRVIVPPLSTDYRYWKRRDVDYSRAPFLQRATTDANRVATAVNNLPSPLDSWGAGGGYWHLYNDWRRDWDQYRVLQRPTTDANRVATVVQPDFDPTLGGLAASYPRTTWPPDPNRAEWQQRSYYDTTLLTTALLEDELLGRDPDYRHASWRRDPYWTDRHPYAFDPAVLAVALLEDELLGRDPDYRHASWRRDPYWVPPGEPGRDPNITFPTYADLTLAGLLAQPYWTWRRDWDQYRVLQRPTTDANRVASAANPLPAPLDSWFSTQNRLWRRDPYWVPPGERQSDPNLLTQAPFDPTQAGYRGSSVPWTDPNRAEWQQPLRISNPSLLSTALLEGPVLIPLGQVYWNWRRDPYWTDRHPYAFDPAVLAMALLEGALLGVHPKDVWRRDPYWVRPGPPGRDPNLQAAAFDVLHPGLDWRRVLAGFNARPDSPAYWQRVLLSDPRFYPNVVANTTHLAGRTSPAMRGAAGSPQGRAGRTSPTAKFGRDTH